MLRDVGSTKTLSAGDYASICLLTASLPNDRQTSKRTKINPQADADDRQLIRSGLRIKSGSEADWSGAGGHSYGVPGDRPTTGYPIISDPQVALHSVTSSLALGLAGYCASTARPQLAGSIRNAYPSGLVFGGRDFGPSMSWNHSSGWLTPG